MITGPEALAARLSGGDAPPFAALLESMLPPLMPDDDGVVQRVIEKLAGLLDTVRESAVGRPPAGENSWRARTSAVALGAADHPAEEPDPTVTGPALAEAAARVEAIPPPDDSTGAGLRPGWAWRWKAGRGQRGKWRWPGAARPLPRRFVGGSLTGRHLTAILGALAASARPTGVRVLSITVTEVPAPVVVPHLARLGVDGRGTRLGLGCRLGPSAVVVGRVVRIDLEARTASAEAWAAFLAAVGRAAHRAVPSWCEVSVRVTQLLGPHVARLQRPARFRLGLGLSLSRTS